MDCSIKNTDQSQKCAGISLEVQKILKEIIIDEYSTSLNLKEKIEGIIQGRNISRISYGPSECFIYDESCIKPEVYPESTKLFAIGFENRYDGHVLSYFDLTICSHKNVNRIKKIYFQENE